MLGFAALIPAYDAMLNPAYDLGFAALNPAYDAMLNPAYDLEGRDWAPKRERAGD